MNIDYEDIPKDKIDSLRKQVFRQNRVIRLWNALSLASAILISSSIALGVFPQSQDNIGRLILNILLAVLLAVLLWKAIVDPQIRRSVERSMKQSENDK
jgi:lipopolysaccharide export LptBFGC system permease protein LptF